MRRKNPDKLKLRDMDTPMVLGVELNRHTLTPQRFPISRRVEEPDLYPHAIGPDLPMDALPESGLLRDIGALSAGQLAAISGKETYEELDALRDALTAYYLLHPNREWKTWVDVWVEFKYGKKGNEK